jgi:hypothetical protein
MAPRSLQEAKFVVGGFKIYIKKREEKVMRCIMTVAVILTCCP